MMCVFSHGREGGPWNSKSVALSQIALRYGMAVAAVDYRGIEDAQARVDKLVAHCRDWQGPFIFVGASLGGHVATCAANVTLTRGLFLLCPAFYMKGYEHLTPAAPACEIAIVHGWRDEMVPVENSVRYAREHGATLHAVDANHRLSTHLEMIGDYFASFVQRVLANVDNRAHSRLLKR